MEEPLVYKSLKWSRECLSADGNSRQSNPKAKNSEWRTL